MRSTLTTIFDLYSPRRNGDRCSSDLPDNPLLPGGHRRLARTSKIQTNKYLATRSFVSISDEFRAHLQALVLVMPDQSREAIAPDSISFGVVQRGSLRSSANPSGWYELPFLLFHNRPATDSHQQAIVGSSNDAHSHGVQYLLHVTEHLSREQDPYRSMFRILSKSVLPSITLQVRYEHTIETLFISVFQLEHYTSGTYSRPCDPVGSHSFSLQ